MSEASASDADRKHEGPHQLENELCRTINRYVDEGDLRIYELFGILEKIKLDYWELHNAAHNSDESEEA